MSVFADCFYRWRIEIFSHWYYSYSMTLEEIKRRTNFIFEEYGVRSAAIFGSVARGEDKENSDIDILVRLGKPMGMFAYMKLINELEKSLQKKVDLVTEKSLNKFVRPYVLPDLKVIYEER